MMDERCLCIELRSAAQKLTHAYDEAMAPSGLSATQFSQMNLIRSLEGATLKELADASQLDRSTLGRNLKVLEKMGLVSTRMAADARSKTIHLSRKGRHAFKRALPLWYAAQNELLERLSGDGREQLDDILAVLARPLSVTHKHKITVAR